MRLVIDDVRGRRTIDENAFPLMVGGGDSALWLGAAQPALPVALVGVDQGALFIQPAGEGSDSVTVNDEPLTESRWLGPGDRILVSGVRVDVGTDPSEGHLVLACGTGEPSTEPPLSRTAKNTQPESPPPNVAASRIRVPPVAFEPRRSDSPRSTKQKPFVWMGRLLLLLVVTGLGVFVFSARAVTFEISPQPDVFDVNGDWPTLSIAGRQLVIPGLYRVHAEKDGYRPLTLEFEVGRDFEGIVRGEFEPLPGRLTVDAGEVQGADVLIDGVHVGVAPLKDLELSLGEHRIEVIAARHQPYESTVTVERPEQEVVLRAQLIEKWAVLTVTSTPAGAEVSIDGRPVGTTPTSVEAGAGKRRLSLRLSGYEESVQRVTIEPGRPVQMNVTLQPAAGVLGVHTDPPGATVTIDGVFKGTAPLETEVVPGREHQIVAALAGHAKATASETVAAGRSRILKLTLVPQTGVVVFVGLPRGAEILVDGESVVTADGSLELLAVPHEVEVRSGDGEPFFAEVTPRPGVRTELKIDIKTQAPPQPPAEVVATLHDAELRLIRPGRFVMGAPRREPGRRSNEVLREVEITRAYYLGTREVTNREYRDFNPDHRSGGIGGRNLEIDHHPVVRVSWEDAARYCNWLSAKEGLEPVYEEQGGRVYARAPLKNGYRLPTEAEWAWAARHPGGGQDQKYPWGDDLPIPAGAGNFADAAASGVVDEVISGYDDGYATTAPAGSFNGDAVGVYNLGGNVSEWVHDVYEVRMPAGGVVETDPTGPAQGEYHVIRGASWMSDRVTELRLSAREAGKDRRPDVGFRIARNVD